MAKYRLKKKVKFPLFLGFVGIFLVILFFVYIVLVSPVDKNSSAMIQVKISQGMSTKEIAKELKKRGLIRSELLFDIVVKVNTRKSLKAAVYQFQKSMSLEEIVGVLTEGSNYNPDLIRITFVEGESIKKYAIKIAEATNHTYDDVIEKMSDTTYLNTLINKYWFLTDDILNSDIYVPLEGYLAPDTYEFESRDVSIERVIEVMLNQTDSLLKNYKSSIESSGRSVHDTLTIASMLELEGTNTKNRKMIAGVFNNRLDNYMNLGSDVTTYYALQVEMTSDLTTAQFNTINPYNTRASNMNGKLPVGPICNPSKSSIEASVYPTENDYLYFVADKKGEIYYTKSQSEHLAKVKELKEAGLWIW